MILFTDKTTQQGFQQVLIREQALQDGMGRHLLRTWIADHFLLFGHNDPEEYMTVIQFHWNPNAVDDLGKPNEFFWMEWRVPTEHGNPMVPFEPTRPGQAVMDPTDPARWLRGMTGGLINHARPGDTLPAWGSHT